MRSRRIVVISAAVALVLVLVLAGIYLGRPSAQVASTARPNVTIECSAVTGVGRDGCLGWGDAILAQGPPSFTFEMDALSRLEIDRPLLGISSSCEVAYFTPRYPDDPAWIEEIPCVEVP